MKKSNSFFIDIPSPAQSGTTQRKPVARPTDKPNPKVYESMFAVKKKKVQVLKHDLLSKQVSEFSKNNVNCVNVNPLRIFWWLVPVLLHTEARF